MRFKCIPLSFILLALVLIPARGLAQTLTTVIKPVIPVTKIAKISEERILSFAQKAKFFNPYLLLAIVRRESSGNPGAFDGKHGSRGLIQILPGTARMVGFKGNEMELHRWDINLKYGMKYLNYLGERYGFGNTEALLASFNAGTPYICKTGRVKSTGERCPIGKYTNQKYVDLVMKEYEEVLLKHVYIPKILSGQPVPVS